MVLVDLDIQLKCPNSIRCFSKLPPYNIGNADFYRDVDADSSFAFTIAAATAAVPVGANNTTVTNATES